MKELITHDLYPFGRISLLFCENKLQRGALSIKRNKILNLMYIRQNFSNFCGDFLLQEYNPLHLRQCIQPYSTLFLNATLLFKLTFKLLQQQWSLSKIAALVLAGQIHFIDKYLNSSSRLITQQFIFSKAEEIY